MNRIGLVAMMLCMAKDEPGGTKGRAKGGGRNPDDADQGRLVDPAEAKAATPEAGWEKIRTDRPFYFAETCRSTPLQGFLLTHEDMPPSDLGAWSAFSLKTTAECLAVPQGEDSDDTPVVFPAGTEVMVKATMNLKRALSRYLMPSQIVEVRIVPLGKEKLSGRRDMWTYDVSMNPKSARSRPALYPFQVPAPRRRPADDDLPF